ncbi:MAG: hypothetical protein CMG74_12445 [Candidatus Marinimicrobia bacterium]|nr:hypothetical protein [Candidatus Neomarinimicrobiota bacterium]|tara:strand:+ start:36480 stop:40100 length:3621 start_codon:yes stop_codon:yes gene_type:complete
MKKLTPAFFTLIFLFILIIQNPFKIGSVEELPIYGEMTEIGDEEDPNGRWEFEWMRTRDPKTNEIPKNIRMKEINFVKNLPNRSQVSMKNVQGGASSLNTLNWRKRGPYNVGGRTRALALDATNENIIIAGGVSGGMWKSVDGGTTWKKTTKPEQLHSVSSVAQDTRTGYTSTWYYGTGELIGNSASGGSAPYRGNGLYKSIDGGDSWSSLTSTASNTPQTFDNHFDYVNRVRVSSVNGYVYAALAYSIKRSKDSGTTWGDLLAGTVNNSVYTDISIDSKGIVYAAMNGKGLWRSADHGDTWTDITPSAFPSSHNRLVIGIAPSNENIVYVIGDLGSDLHTLWKYTYSSGDGSGSNGTWVDLSANIPAFGGLAGDFNSQGGYDLILEVKPDDPDFVILGGTNVYRSSNGYSSASNTKWIGGYALSNNYAMYENHHPDQHGFVFLPSDPNTAFSSHDGGVSKTTSITDDAVTWTSLSNGYYTTQFYHVTIDQSKTDPDLVMGGLQDNGTWKSNVDSETHLWESVAGGDGAFSAFAFNAKVRLWSYQNGKVYLEDFRNGGYNWIRLTPAASHVLFINPFILNSADEKILYYAGGSTVWRNNNIDISDATNYAGRESTQWENMTNAQSANTITALATTTTSPTNRLYYGDNLGIVRKVDNADSGNGSGVSDISGSAFPSGYVSNIAVNPENGDELIATFSNYNVKSIWHSNDAGATWSDISGNLEENSDGSGNGPSVRAALILKHKSTQMYFVGTSTGLYSTTNLNGTSTTWVHEGAQLIGNVVVDALAGRESDGYIAVATHGAGVFTVNLNDNSKPVIAALSDVSFLEDGVYEVGFSVSDTDGDALTYSAKSDTNAVTTEVLSTMVIKLTPKADWNGIANITFYASDGSETDSTTFKLTVTPVNDIAVVQDKTIDEDNTTDVTLESTFAGTTTFTAVSDTNGVATTISSSKLTLTPTANWYGVANITAYASDGTFKDSISFNLTVNSVQDAPYAFEWVSSPLDTINISQTNTTDIYKLEWTESVDVDGDTINYILYGGVGVYPKEEVYDTTSTSLPIPYQEFLNNTFEQIPMLARATVKFTLSATDGIDTVKVTGDDRVVFVNRYDYLSTEEAGIPTEFALHENYPNPFNPTTSLRFDLPEVTDVTVTIFNMLGQKIKTFIMNDTPAGYHSIKWDATNDYGNPVGAGVYLYQLRANQFVMSRKMVLLK